MNINFGHIEENKNEQGGMLQFYITGSANTEEHVTFQGTKGRIILKGPAHIPQQVKVCYDEKRGKVREEIFHYPLPDDSWTQWNYPHSIGFIIYEIEEVNNPLRKGLI